VQPYQDNRDIMVKKLEKGSNGTTSTHQQGQVKKRKIQEKKDGHVQPKDLNMGHNSSMCPMEIKNKKKLVHYDFAKLRKDKAGTYAIRVIDSSQTSMRAIWIPKHLVTNLDGPNKFWVPKGSC
jgi:hypothetical protein